LRELYEKQVKNPWAISENSVGPVQSRIPRSTIPAVAAKPATASTTFFNTKVLSEKVLCNPASEVGSGQLAGDIRVFGAERGTKCGYSDERGESDQRDEEGIFDEACTSLIVQVPGEEVSYADVHAHFGDALWLL
jgi:hypothetical protein